MSADQLREAEEYVRRMLRRDMAIEPTELEITRLAIGLLAAGAFAPDDPELTASPVGKGEPCRHVK